MKFIFGGFLKKKKKSVVTVEVPEKSDKNTLHEGPRTRNDSISLNLS
jgi:hypothetical protein